MSEDFNIYDGEVFFKIKVIAQLFMDRFERYGGYNPHLSFSKEVVTILRKDGEAQKLKRLLGFMEDFGWTDSESEKDDIIDKLWYVYKFAHLLRTHETRDYNY